MEAWRAVLALTGGQDLAQDDLGDLRPLDAGALERLLDGDLAQVVGWQRGKRPVEGPDRRTGRADDDDIVFHVVTPFRVRLDSGGNLACRLTVGCGNARMTRGDPSPSTAFSAASLDLGTGLSIERIAGLVCINCLRGRARRSPPASRATRPCDRPAPTKRWPGAKKQAMLPTGQARTEIIMSAEPVVIKQYAGRRLYNPAAGSY